MWAGPSGRVQERFEVISGTIILWAALNSCLMCLYFSCSGISFGRSLQNTLTHRGQPAVYCVLSGASVVLTLRKLLPAPTQMINVRVLRCLSTCCSLFTHKAQETGREWNKTRSDPEFKWTKLLHMSWKVKDKINTKDNAMTASSKSFLPEQKSSDLITVLTSQEWVLMILLTSWPFIPAHLPSWNIHLHSYNFKILLPDIREILSAHVSS